MNQIWEKVIAVLNDQQIKDFFSGKTSPVIKTESVVKADAETLKTAGMYIISGLVASGVVVGVFILIAGNMVVKAIKNKSY